MSSPRVVFAGTPAFALASLEALVEAEMRPIAVLTQPDRPAGRGRRLTASPVKRYAESLQIDLLQPESLRDTDVVERLRGLAPDVLVVAAYGLLLPQAVLDLPRHGCVNVHASLLPRWRGAAPIQAAILAGDRETGVCLMQMDAGLDTGPVYACERLPLEEDVTAGELHDRLAPLGARLLAARLPAILDGRLRAVPQDDALATVAAKIRKHDAELDWRQPAAELERRVRAFNPAPGARFRCLDETVKCWRAALGRVDAGPPGRVLAAGADGIEVACGEGSLRLLELQRPGRRRVSAAELSAQLDLAGRRLA